jgi:hypothetical protein
MSNPYLKAKRDQYEHIRSQVTELQQTAVREDRDLTDDELEQIHERSDQARTLAAHIEELAEFDERSAATADLAGRLLGEGGAVEEARRDQVPPLMPSRPRMERMRTLLRSDEPTPLRFTTLDADPDQQDRAVVTLAGDVGTPTAKLDTRVLEPRRISRTAGLIVENVSGAEGVTFPVFGAGAAGVAAENAAKTEYDAINPGTAAPQMINVWTDFTRQATESHPSFEQRLRSKLASLVAAREDVLLQAKVMATTGIQTQGFVAGSQASAVLVGAAKVQAAIGQPPDLALVNPVDIGLLFGAGLANTPPGELAELDLNLFGMRVYPTNAQTAGFVLAGAWLACSRFIVGMDPTYFVDPYSGLKNNRVTTLLEEAVDLAVEEPTGFISVDIVTP